MTSVIDEGWFRSLRKVVTIVFKLLIVDRADSLCKAKGQACILVDGGSHRTADPAHQEEVLPKSHSGPTMRWAAL